MSTPALAVLWQRTAHYTHLRLQSGRSVSKVVLELAHERTKAVRRRSCGECERVWTWPLCFEWLAAKELIRGDSGAVRQDADAVRLLKAQRRRDHHKVRPARRQHRLQPCAAQIRRRGSGARRTLR